MTEVVLELPDPIFQKGDVLRWGNLIVHIYSVRIKGEWSYWNGEIETWSERGIQYHCTVQAGKGPEGDVIRPGTCTGFRENDSYSDQIKIEWDNPILEPDNISNLAERQDAWDHDRRATTTPDASRAS